MTSVPTTHEGRARADVEEVNRHAGDNPVRIGIITPLNEPGDPTAGELVVRGARLGAEYVREHGGTRGGRQVEFVLYDDQATAAEEGMAKSSAAQMAKLALVDGVVAAMGQWHLRTTPWVVDVASRYDLPIFVENGHSLVTAQKRRNVFRSYFSIADRVPVMLDFAASAGMRRIGLIAADTVFGQQMADTLVEYGTQRHGMEFLRFDFPQDDTVDFREQLRAIRDFEPDLFINGAVIKTNYMIIEQATEIGLRPNVPMMVTFGFPLRSEDFWRLSGKAGVGTMWPAMRYRPSWEGLTDIGRWFIDRYTERYGSFPPDTALTHFTDVTIIAAALDAARSDSREDLLDALEAMEFPTWRGPVRFGRGPAHWHHDAPELALLQYQEYEQSFDESAIIHPPQTATAAYLPPAGLSA
ncbi:ABC transporter substrate-binding protein [Streptomyces sp. DH37]|uniref:ABC transporter substrate-binding protein n=1 Tax=Streptomyces sp. DH37 TaxID=3040122 RepID=UPI002442AF5F|nr:ABC transporter substrate-binding protein [Streptomyces sp. DH37]MDG9703202.1 ABC transporter substrate-binding protein [Streptomyces sp. DH37]